MQINGAYNPVYLQIMNQVTPASITDGLSNSVMFGEITRSMAVQNTAAEVPIASKLSVPRVAFGQHGVHDERHAAVMPDADRLAQVSGPGSIIRALPSTAFFSTTLTPNQ